MSKYTTGEIAKLCGVSVRTVQYYDTRNILTPSELTEGGRRLYSEEDLKRMKIICFLRDAGISINSIGELLSEHDPGSVISVLLEQQENILKEEIHERQVKLDMLDGIKQELKTIENFSIESIGDIAYAMENKKKMRKLHANTGVSLCIGGTVLLAYLLSIIPKAKWYSPTILMNTNSLLMGVEEIDAYIKAIVITVFLCIVCVAVSIPIINKRQL